MAKLGDIFEAQPKSKVKAGEGKEKGKYRFYNSSNEQTKFYDEAQYFKPALIFGTGGNASVHYCDEPFATSTDCIVFFSNTENINVKLVYQYLSGNIRILEEGFKGAGIKHISKGFIQNIRLDFPDLEMQNSISQTLDKVTHTIDLCNAILEKLDLLVKARFVEMFGSVYEKRFDTITIPQFASKDKNSIKRGPFGGALKKEDFVEDGYLVYEQRHAIHNDFQYEKYFITREKYESMIGFKVVPGDLIISCSGVTLGRIAEIPNGAKEGIINQALLKLSLDKTKMMNAFFIHQFRSEEIQDILFGFSRGSGIPNMPSMSEVKAVKFICPPLELQQQFADFVEQTDKSKLAVKQVLEKAETLKKALMQEYFG